MNDNEDIKDNEDNQEEEARTPDLPNNETVAPHSSSSTPAVSQHMGTPSPQTTVSNIPIYIWNTTLGWIQSTTPTVSKKGRISKKEILQILLN